MSLLRLAIVSCAGQAPQNEDLRTVDDAMRKAKFPVADYIHTIDRLGNTVYCGTSHGLYTVRGNQVTQLRFEPDDQGKLVMVPREVPDSSVPGR